MNTKCLKPSLFSVVCLQLLTCLNPVKAQHAYQRSTTYNRTTYRRGKNDLYGSWYLSAGALNCNNKPADISVNLPYTTRYLNGQTNSNTFYGGGQNLFPKNYSVFDLTHLSIGYKKVCFDLGFGILNRLNPDDKNVSSSEMLNAGIGLNCKIGKKSRFLIKPTINISYSDFGVDLGYVINVYAYVDALGLTAYPTYTKHSGHHSYTVNATSLYFDLDQQIVSIYPKITFCGNPTKSGLYWGVDVAYNIAISRRESLNLYQRGSDHSTNDVGNINLTDSRINFFYNNNRTTQTPLNFNALYVGFSIGYTFK